MRALLLLLVLAVMTLVGSRAAADSRVAGRARIVSAALPSWVFVAVLFMGFVLAGCGISDTCEPDACAKCRVTTDAAAPIAYVYMALVGVGWLASVVEGFGGNRGRQARLLTLTAGVSVAMPIPVIVALVLYRIS